MENLYHLLRELRKKEPLRVAAERAGISHTYLSQLEKGIDKRTGKQIQPSTEILRRLAKAYNYPYEKLLAAAGYLKDSKQAPSPATTPAIARKIIDSIAYAKDLKEEDYELIADHLEVLLKYVKKKNVL